MRQLVMLLALAVSLGACADSSSPTSPAPIPPPVVVAPVIEEPIPPVVETPVEPVPVPVPSPAPAPPAPPAPRLVYAAATDSAHWYGPALVPNRFQVEIFDGSVQFGSLRLDIAQRSADAILLSVRNELSVSLVRESGDRWRWTVNGLAGLATGTMTRD
jgi:hypothetical protein